MGIAMGIASVASSVYGAYKQGEAADAAKAAAQGAAYVPPLDSYQDKGYEERRAKQEELYGKVGKGSEFRGGQKDLASMLTEKAQGKGPSLAQNTLQEGVESAQNIALGSAAGRPGAAGGLGLRNLLGAQGGLAMGAANKSALLGLKEQDIATGRLGNVLNQGRSGDQRQNTQMLQILQQQNVEDQANRNALMGRERLIQKGKSEAATGVAKAEIQKGGAQAKMWGGLSSGLSGAAARGFGSGMDDSIGNWWDNLGTDDTTSNSYNPNAAMNKFRNAQRGSW